MRTRILHIFGLGPEYAASQGGQLVVRARAPYLCASVGQWNHYRIRLDGGDLQIFVNGVLQNKARWCEELAGPIALQSEGAEIEFRRVTLRPITGHAQVR